VRFAILGPVRAWLADAELETGSPTQRALLALLLVHAGQPVALTEIVDVLWQDDPPRTAVNIVHRHVGALRRLTDPGLPARATGRLLLPSSGGYRLAVDAESLDLLRFRELHESARRAANAGSVAEATDLYVGALAQWQGPIGQGIPENVRAHPAFVAVGREYLAAVQEAAEAALAAGSPQRILPALEQAAHDHPLDEALQAKLMMVLAATGDQAKAVQAYQAVRDQLAGELGVDPGPELREAHARVLRQAPPKPRPRSQVPSQLPADLPSFAGRGTELARTAALLGEQNAMTTIAIFGMGGVGKTTLAVHLAHEVADQFPDGQLYVSLHGFDPAGVVSSSEAVRGFLETLGVPPHRMPADLDGQTALYRSLLAGRRMLVLVDDARDTEHARPLLPGTPGCMVIITSRTQLLGLVARSGAHPVALDPPTLAEARDIFVHRLGAARVAAESDAVDEIIARCGRLPLALAVVAARAATFPDVPLAAIAGELREGDLDAFGEPDADIDVRTVFSWSYRAVTPDAARLYRLLGLHPGPEISLPAAASLAGSPVRQVRALLDELSGAHLVNEQISGRYEFHDLLRAYAAELTASEDDSETRQAARSRLLDHYLHHADAAARLLFPHRDRAPVVPPPAGPADLADHQQADSWLRQERPVLLALAALAAETGFERHTWQLAAAIELFLDRQGRWQEQIVLQQNALAGARRLGDNSPLAHAHRALGFAHGRLSRQTEADTHLQNALELFAGADDANGEAATHRNMAFLANRQGNHRVALDHYARAMDLYESNANQSGRATVFNEAGWTHILLGDYEQALAQCGQAVRLHTRIGNHSGEAAASDSLGYAYHHLGRHEDAIAHYQHALTLYRRLTDRYLEADTLSHIGDARAALGDHDSAATAWRQALLILDELGHPDAKEVRGKLRVINRGEPLASGHNGQ
jgi:DNA-binding SARP family transcriptional activator/tetratricopeptide (TPR) repeat protein